MKLIPINELNISDTLDQDLENSAGVVIITSGSVVTEALRKRIMSLPIDYIYIKEHALALDSDHATFEERLNNEFTLTVKSFKNVFNAAKFGKKIAVDEFLVSIQPLVSQIAKNNNILGNLRKIQLNDTYTYKHSINVGLISVMIGK